MRFLPPNSSAGLLGWDYLSLFTCYGINKYRAYRIEMNKLPAKYLLRVFISTCVCIDFKTQVKVYKIILKLVSE